MQLIQWHRSKIKVTPVVPVILIPGLRVLLVYREMHLLKVFTHNGRKDEKVL